MPSIEEIKKRFRERDGKPPVSVDKESNINIDGRGTKVPTNIFHTY
jgi:hypothetical protein